MFILTMLYNNSSRASLFPSRNGFLFVVHYKCSRKCLQVHLVMKLWCSTKNQTCTAAPSPQCNPGQLLRVFSIFRLPTHLLSYKYLLCFAATFLWQYSCSLHLGTVGHEYPSTLYEIPRHITRFCYILQSNGVQMTNYKALKSLYPNRGMPNQVSKLKRLWHMAIPPAYLPLFWMHDEPASINLTFRPLNKYYWWKKRIMSILVSNQMCRRNENLIIVRRPFQDLFERHTAYMYMKHPLISRNVHKRFLRKPMCCS